MNEVAFDSEPLAGAGNNGSGHTLTPHDDSYQAAYNAGVASAQEAAYRQGYQAGFADGLAQSQRDAGNPADTAPRAKNGDGRVKRLRGLPCAQCGVSLYSDESTCRCCGAPKATRADRS